MNALLNVDSSRRRYEIPVAENTTQLLQIVTTQVLAADAFTPAPQKRILRGSIDASTFDVGVLLAQMRSIVTAYKDNNPIFADKLLLQIEALGSIGTSVNKIPETRGRSTTTTEQVVVQEPVLIGLKRKAEPAITLSLIHIPSPRDRQKSRMPSSA